MKKKENPWLPWKETVRKDFPIKGGRILVIIPTAGNNIEMVKRCLGSLRLASKREKIRIIIILSPSTTEKKKRFRRLFGKSAEIISLSGCFNYCRSINKGLSMRNKKDKYVLFLNDDVTFTNEGDIHKLKTTLVKEGWACVGPFINYNPNRHDPTWPKEKSSLGFIPKSSGAIRTNLPVSGSCSLWDLELLGRIGKLDEKFGEGWGMDEADLCLRAIRLGARYGRQDSVAINHIMHATFGEEFTRYAGPAHMKSLNYFKEKYGENIEEWGKSHHWFPLPGIQVIVFPSKNIRKFKKFLEKIENELRGFRWILLLVINTSDCKSYKISKGYCEKTNADRYIIKKFEKEGLSKKEIVDKIVIKRLPLKERYPSIFIVDAEKGFSKNCLSELLWQIRDGGYIAGKIGSKETIAEEILPDVDFLEFRLKNSKEVYKNCSIFHVKCLKN